MFPLNVCRQYNRDLSVVNTSVRTFWGRRSWFRGCDFADPPEISYSACSAGIVVGADPNRPSPL